MYQVIARKYRPQNFSELIGQEHVQKTLVNAIESNRLAHGYIFAGQRGTGKTTVARILARCLNCINGPTATPCGTCSSCVEIAAGNSVDVIEIDAASNRGINEMREVRENVRYRPARDKYKVFIIDEAHQITKEAFNALLKTLEEPPEWTVFVLCTTEAHEIPNTIASRCQQFSFRSVDFGELIERMKYIVREEGIETSDEVLAVIAQAGEGSVRDSLSALDQAIACCGKTLSVDDVRDLLGMFGADSLSAISDAVERQDGGRMLDIVQELERNGRSLQHFSRELSRYWRNLLVAKISGKPTRLIAAADREQQIYLATAAGFSEEDLTRYLNLTLELHKTLQSSLQPRLHLELGLIKLVHASRLQPLEEALAQMGSLPKGSLAQTSVSPGNIPVSTTKPVTQAPPLTASSRVDAPRPALFQTRSTKIARAPEPLAPADEQLQNADAVEPKQTLHDALATAGMTFSADALLNSEVTVNGGTVTIKAPKVLTMALKDASVERIAAQAFGRPMKVNVEVGENMTNSRPSGTQAVTGAQNGDDEVRRRALEHPGVKRFQELFPDAQVRQVRNLSD